jgi:uncharacterized protein
MNYPRKILKPIEKYLETPEIIVLTGMRRVGKTTVLRMIYEEIESKNKAFFDLENPLEQKIFEEKDFNNIWANLVSFGIDKSKKSYIFLDEIQAQPAIIKAIKYLYDHYQVKFFLTGSSSYYLKNLFPESLAGRKIVFELYPLDFEEFLTFKNSPKLFNNSFVSKNKGKNLITYEKTIKLYEEYLNFGGFPQVVLASDNEQKKFYLNDIFKSYFEKDVQILADFRELSSFRDLLILLTQRIGSKIDVTKLASELGISRQTVNSYLSFLKSTYFIYLISPYSQNIDRELRSIRKLYLCDNGLINQISQIGTGSLFENAVFLNLKKYGKINYFQKKSGSEIDFILENKVALEVKSSGSASEYAKLKRMAGVLGLKEQYIITKSFNKDINFIPAIEI